MNSFPKERTFDFLWIPGHYVIRGNEIADDLERLRAGQPLTGHRPAVQISHTDQGILLNLVGEKY